MLWIMEFNGMELLNCHRLQPVDQKIVSELALAKRLINHKSSYYGICKSLHPFCVEYKK